MSGEVSYRRSVTPGTPVSSKSQQRLKELRCDPLGRLVLQLAEIDMELKDLRSLPKRPGMVIATLMALKYNVLKELMPYAYSKVPQEQAANGTNLQPVIINIDGKAVMEEEQGLLTEINEALEEAREAFPDYKPVGARTPIGPGWKTVV
jgi:hypothetical protein